MATLNQTCVCFITDFSSSSTEATDGVTSGGLEEGGPGILNEEVPLEAIFPTCFPPLGILKVFAS